MNLFSVVASFWIAGAAIATPIPVPTASLGPPPAIEAPVIARNSPTPVATPSSAPNLDAALREEATQYRLYLTNLADQLKYIVGGLVLVASVIIGILNWKSGSDITKQINARFQATIDKQLATRMETFNRDLEKAKSDTAKNIYRIDCLVDYFGEFASALTLAFYVLNQREKTKEWEMDRQQAISELQNVRKDLPDWRRVAILLGRLYKANEEYAAGVRILNEVMTFRDEAGLPRDGDYAALLFNSACYRNLEAGSLAKQANLVPQMVESARNAAWNDLKASIQLDPNNLKQAVGNQDLPADPDFDGLWNDDTRRKDRLQIEAKAGQARPLPPPKTPGKVWKWLHKQLG